MKFEITVLSIMLMVRVCYCAVHNNNTVASTTVRASNSSKPAAEPSDNPLRNMIGCLRDDSVFKCFNDRVGVLIKVWREALLNSVRRNGDQPLQVNQGLEQMIKDFGKAVYYGVSSFFSSFSLDDDDEGRANAEDANPTDKSGTALERGHHKKKKVHKEIKKLVIKIIIAIFLVMQKIKWALLMIQTIFLNNFILVATLFLLSKTFKVWHELKHKPHIEKQVVVYDNVHHQHYDNGEHSDVEEGHGHNHGWGWWGRSFQTQTESSTVSELDYENDYYSRVTRSALGRSRKRRSANTNYLTTLNSS